MTKLKTLCRQPQRFTSGYYKAKILKANDELYNKIVVVYNDATPSFPFQIPGTNKLYTFKEVELVTGKRLLSFNSKLSQ